MKVAVVQSGAEPCATERNLARLDPVLDDLARRGVGLALLPEFFPTGNVFEERVLEAVVDSGDRVEDWLTRRSSELGMVLAGSYVAIEDGDAWNRFGVFEPDGRRAWRHKRSSPAPEALYYRAADRGEPTVETGLGRVGLLMCIEMSEPELVLADLRDCALVLVAFAIPGRFPIPGRILRRLVDVPPALARRNGTPVLLSSMGGPLESAGSPVLPIRQRGRYAGRSGIHLPEGTVAGPLAPGEVGVATAEIPLGPRVAEPDPHQEVDCGVPWRVSVFDLLRSGRARTLYRRNLDRLLGRADADR